MAAESAAILGLILKLRVDRWLAHRHLFAHRHPDASPDAHRELVEAIYSASPRVSIEGFRGFAKSTYLEEAAVLRACNREFHNMVLVGSSYTRACDRLAAVKREIEQNEIVHELYGLDRPSCSTWQEGKIVLATGICIQALGREQSTVGIKHLDWRPDAVLVDDVEDPDEVRTDAEREQSWGWFIKTLLPSLDHPLHSWVRVLGTRRGGGSLPERLENKDRKWGRYRGWPTVKFPIEHLDEKGERQATWPAKFPLPEIDAIRATYSGDMTTFMQEYMCEATSEADHIFTRSMIRVVPRIKTWEPVYAMMDPARTTNRRSAMTGWAAWSWIGNRLIVWGADGQRLLPDEIVALAFDIAERFDPVHLGFEEDGLNEWALQPLRHEAAKRGVFLPLKPMRAPRGKIPFIGGLQPRFMANEVEFAQALPTLADQLVSFPAGAIDVPNALAYAQLMRPGQPVYEGFSQEHIAEAPEYDRTRPLSLVANATGSLLAAALVQSSGDRLVVLNDWVMEGQPADLVPRIWQEATEAGDTARMVTRPRAWDEMLKGIIEPQVALRRTPPVWVVPPRHAERWTNVGLLQAARHIPSETRLGGGELAGRRRLSGLLAAHLRGMPAVQVASGASWTLRALAGGYARGLAKGALKDEPEAGPYRVLMEGLESFLGMAYAQDDESADDINYRVDPRSGRRYVSAMPERIR